MFRQGFSRQLLSLTCYFYGSFFIGLFFFSTFVDTAVAAGSSQPSPARVFVKKLFFYSVATPRQRRFFTTLALNNKRKPNLAAAAAATSAGYPFLFVYNLCRTMGLSCLAERKREAHSWRSPTTCRKGLETVTPESSAAIGCQETPNGWRGSKRLTTAKDDNTALRSLSYCPLEFLHVVANGKGHPSKKDERQ